MTFERDVFISYSHFDNQPLTKEQKGWVSHFHETLQNMLNARIGHKAEIWLDERELEGNDIFAAEIIQQFPKTALLVAVLSPSYVSSEWCKREVSEFCRVAQESGGVAVGNKSRILKVIKMPVASEEPLPPPVKQTEGYKFFATRDETPLELDPAYGREMAEQFNVKLARLALDVKDLLERLCATAPAGKDVAQPVSDKPAVYLAQCCCERHDAREALATELRLCGYPVLPDQPLPTEEEGYITEVRKLLEHCGLSIHLVGSGYGMVPDGSGEKSVVMLQNELAVERSRTGRLRRVIWLPEGTHSRHPEQQLFIEALHNDTGAQLGADLITADLEALKSAVHNALRDLEKSKEQKSQQPCAASGTRLVYLVCDERDRPATVALRKFLRSRSLEVQIPLFEGDAGAVRKANQDLLASCDAVLLFYGAGDEAWKRTVESDLRKVNGYGREKTLLSSYTYLAQPTTGDKKDLVDLEEPYVINALEGFSENSMQPFLVSLRG